MRDQTVREIVVPSVGGTQIRVRLTNAFGIRPLHVAEASVGLAGVHAGLLRPAVALPFSRRSSVVIPAGQDAFSDPVSLRVKPRQRLAVSLFVHDPTGSASVHAVAEETTFLAAGNHALSITSAPFGRRTTSWYFLDGVSVWAPADAGGAVVALGDSLTDGLHSTLGGNDRWPDDLARRLQATHGLALSVVDAGIAGNRVLTSSACYGRDAVDRFTTDVLSSPGVRAVILLEGTNDLGMSQSVNWCSVPHRTVTARQVIAGYERIIAEAHSDGLRIFGGTLPPFRGAAYWNAAAEGKREAINHWVQRSGAFDGVIDFARALASPRDPQRLARRYDSGDHLHPNDAGYAAMARAVDIAALRRSIG